MMKVAIFDMDGTLLDSMRLWRSMNISFVQSLGITPSDKQVEEMYNLTGAMTIPYVKREFGVDVPFEQLFDRACAQVLPHYEAGIAHKPGILAYLQRLRARGVKCAVATATPAAMALTALNQAGLTPYMDYIFTTDMLDMSKRSAAFFDKLCALIGEKNGDCVMFEDALYAMKGAREAGLGVVGITDMTNMHDREAIGAVCDKLIDSYDEMP